MPVMSNTRTLCVMLARSTRACSESLERASPSSRRNVSCASKLLKSVSCADSCGSPNCGTDWPELRSSQMLMCVCCDVPTTHVYIFLKSPQQTQSTLTVSMMFFAVFSSSSIHSSSAPPVLLNGNGLGGLNVCEFSCTKQRELSVILQSSHTLPHNALTEPPPSCPIPHCLVFPFFNLFTSK